MASLSEILTASDGSLVNAESIALQAIANGKPEFWLDLALILSVQGKFTGARQAQSKYLDAFPACSRVRYGMAPFALYDGDLQSGLKLLEYGRNIQCWGGCGFPNVSAPEWDGDKDISGKTILLHGEGGIGDEILNLRAADWIKSYGAKCIAACSREIMPIADTAGAAAIIDIANVGAAQYDYWIPSMSAARLTKRTWSNLWSGQYIFNKNDNIKKSWKKIIKNENKINIGLRWQGNPKFEHEQLRLFDPNFLFKSTENKSISRWSLQKESNTDIPDDVVDLDPFLSTWNHTVAAMSELDLVITSCTSIAHVSGALNIPTWVIVPVMPYYPWSRPGSKTDWYPNVTLYRQEKYGDWSAPFNQIAHDLNNLIQEKT